MTSGVKKIRYSSVREAGKYMQISDRWLFFIFRRSKRNQDSTSYDGHKQGSNFSQASTYSRSEAESTNPPSRIPHRSLTKDFYSSFISCFAPPISDNVAPCSNLSFSIADHPIIHRDIKASNILLTDNLRAKVADFGFARLAAKDPDVTHISTQIKGTAGYLDPEYIRTYQLTEKSDVYSFGVLLVELVTGRRPIERGRDLKKDRITTQWAMQKFEQGEVVIAMDPRLRRSSASIRAVDEVMALAYACLASPRNSRPSMKRCAEVLWGIRRDFHTPLLPGEPPDSSSIRKNPSYGVTGVKE